MIKASWNNIWKKIAFYLLLLILWEAIYRIGVDVLGSWKSYSFPSPVSMSATLFGLIADGCLGIAIIRSLQRLVTGYLISVAVGTTIGFLIVKSKFISESIDPIILGLQTLPNICWLPFAILWYGLNENAIIFVIAVGSCFAITISVEAGIRNINPIFLKAAKTMGARGIKMYRHVIIPAALPNIISGFKQGWSFAWRALIASEMLSATVGLGQILMIGRDLADINQVTSVIVVIILLGLLIDKIFFSRVEKTLRRRWGFDRAG